MNYFCLTNLVHCILRLSLLGGKLICLTEIA